jgi:hypothetical protein
MLVNCRFLTLNNKDLDTVKKTVKRYFLRSDNEDKDSDSETELKHELSDEDKEFEENYKLEPVSSYRLMTMMRCEVKHGRAEGETKALLEAALEHRTSHPEEVGPVESKAVSLFIKWMNSRLR